MQELRRSRPTTLQEMKDTVEGFVNSLEVEETRSAVFNLRKRALVCQHRMVGPLSPASGRPWLS